MGMGSGRCRRCHRWGCNRPLRARVLLASQPVYDSTGRIVGYMGQPVQVCTTAARLRRSTAARLCRSSAARQRCT
jgi:hypothetical protein